jgi:hypothetical protein
MEDYAIVSLEYHMSYSHEIPETFFLAIPFVGKPIPGVRIS